MSRAPSSANWCERINFYVLSLAARQQHQPKTTRGRAQRSGSTSLQRAAARSLFLFTHFCQTAPSRTALSAGDWLPGTEFFNFWGFTHAFGRRTAVLGSFLCWAISADVRLMETGTIPEHPTTRHFNVS